jgi:hypothetical protein
MGWAAAKDCCVEPTIQIERSGPAGVVAATIGSDIATREVAGRGWGLVIGG